MNTPIMDGKTLGRVAWEALLHSTHDPMEQDAGYRVLALAVRDAVCPPSTHIVVPRAEHDALWRFVRAHDRVEVDINDHNYETYRAAVEELKAARAALATEPTPGKESTA
jgi:hypothetical protein